MTSGSHIASRRRVPADGVAAGVAVGFVMGAIAEVLLTGGAGTRF